MESFTSPGLAPLDQVVVGAYLLVVLAIGFVVARRTHTGEDLFLAGRRLGWAAIGLSLFASNISSTTLIGLSGAAYTGGISVANYEWMAAVVLVVFVMWYLPAYIRTRISTVPEFLELRYTRGARVYFSGLSVFSNIVVDTAGSLFAGALVLQLFFPGLDLATTCLILALVAGVYTAAGGLAAVVYTDVLQAVVLLVGSSVTAWLLFAEVDFSWARVVAETPPEARSLIRPLDDPQLPWLGTLVGVPILGFYFWCTNQFIVQRVLGARDLDQARWGALFGGLLKLPVLFLMVLPGLMARLVFPDLEQGDAVFPTLLSELLPVGLAGLVLAALVAAIMSSVDSTLNSAATLVTLDFVKPRHPRLSPTAVATVGRVTIGLFMVLAALWAPQIARFEGLFAYLQQMLAYIVPPVVVLFVPGLFWRRGARTAALPTLMGGHLVSITAFIGQQQGWLPDLHFTIMAGLLFLVSACIFLLASLVGKPPPPELLERLRPPPAPVRTGWAWLTDHRLLGAALLALTLWLVLAFW